MKWDRHPEINGARLLWPYAPAAQASPLDNVPLHIMQREHKWDSCIFGEEDYRVYLHLLGEALVKKQGRASRLRPHDPPCPSVDYTSASDAVPQSSSP